MSMQVDIELLTTSAVQALEQTSSACLKALQLTRKFLSLPTEDLPPPLQKPKLGLFYGRDYFARDAAQLDSAVTTARDCLYRAGIKRQSSTDPKTMVQVDFTPRLQARHVFEHECQCDELDR